MIRVAVLAAAAGLGGVSAAQPLAGRIVALQREKLLALSPASGGRVVTVADGVRYASLSPGGRWLVFMRTVEVKANAGRGGGASAGGSTDESKSAETERREQVVVIDCAARTPQAQVLLVMPAEAAQRAMRDRYVAWSPTGSRLAFVGLNQVLDACVFVAQPAGRGRSGWQVTPLPATVAARDQGLRVRSFNPAGTALVCENRLATYVVSLADGSIAQLPGIFHSWSPEGDLLACNGNYRYPAQHFGLHPDFWDRTLVGAPLFRLVYAGGRVKAVQKSAVFLRWSPDGKELVCRSTQARGSRGLWLYLVRTNALGRSPGRPLCQAPAQLRWHPGGDLVAWCNAGGCFVASLKARQSVRVPGTVAGGWCCWAPTVPQRGENPEPRLLYWDADHFELVSATGAVLAQGRNPFVGGSAPAEKGARLRPARAAGSQGRGPDLVWSPGGRRFAVSDGTWVVTCDLATAAVVGRGRLPGREGAGPEGRSRPSPAPGETRVLVGWTGRR